MYNPYFDVWIIQCIYNLHFEVYNPHFEVYKYIFIFQYPHFEV